MADFSRPTTYAYNIPAFVRGCIAFHVNETKNLFKKTRYDWSWM